MQIGSTNIHIVLSNVCYLGVAVEYLNTKWTAMNSNWAEVSAILSADLSGKFVTHMFFLAAWVVVSCISSCLWASVPWWWNMNKQLLRCLSPHGWQCNVHGQFNSISKLFTRIHYTWSAAVKYESDWTILVLTSCTNLTANTSFKHNIISSTKPVCFC